MNGKKAKILVVDDEKTYIDVLVGLLADDYKIIIAKSGEQALKNARTDSPPALILLDIMMPGMGGYDVCRELKKTRKTRNIPVIFLSALNEVKNKTMGFEAGGVDYITKPFQAKEVLARVKTHMQIQELHGKLERENARFKSLAEAAFEGIIIHQNGMIMDANSEAGRLFRCCPGEMLNRNLMEYIPSESHDVVAGVTERPWEGEIPVADDSVLFVEIRTKKMGADAPDVMVTAIRDLSVQKAIEKEKQALQNENLVLKGGMRERYKFGDMIGRSPAMQSVYELVAKAASSDFHVIIYGESGTGKELAARTIHRLSRRGNGSFVAVNCSAVTESIFEREFFGHQKGSFTHASRDRQGFFDAAHTGALFLDELGELKPEMQVKLLRVLESGEYVPVGGTAAKKADVRIISATHRDLPALIREKKFREDLFYRIHVIEITLPPLRERKEDIAMLIDHFLSCFSPSGKPVQIPGKILDALYHHDWPGNVRELQNAVQRFLATNQLHLPGRLTSFPGEDEAPDQAHSLNRAVEALERRMILDSLMKTNWHRGAAADLLQIPRRTLQRKMAKYDFRKQAGND